MPANHYTNDHFPCLVSGGAVFEELSGAETREESYRIHARNALRHLTYGLPLFQGSPWRWSNLKIAWSHFYALFLKKDPELLKALRFEMKALLKNACLKVKDFDPAAEARLVFFINTLLSNFPFMDPAENEEVQVPKKINNQWREVTYRFHKIDLSPKSGWWQRFIEEDDRLYAYAMEPQDPEAPPHLLLMGTTYLSGQGSALSLLGDLTPDLSVGERHDLTDLEIWLMRHKKVYLSGHSQGGTMAMIVAAKYPEYIEQADCLNPTALTQKTANLLNGWWKLPRSRQPRINVFTQEDDFAFIVGQAFLKGTRIFLVSNRKAVHASKYVAHAHHYLGHEDAHYHELPKEEQKLDSLTRQFINDLKYVADRSVGLLLIANFVLSRCKRKLQKLIDEYAVFAAMLFTIALLLLATIFPPIAAGLTVSLLHNMGPIVSFIGLDLIIVGAGIVTAFFAPKLTEVALTVGHLALSVLSLSLAGFGLGLGLLVAGLKAMKTACFGGQAPLMEPEQPLALPLESRSHSTVHSLTQLGLRAENSALSLPRPLRRRRSESDLASLSILAKVKNEASSADQPALPLQSSIRPQA